MNGYRILFSCCGVDFACEYESPLLTSLIRVETGTVEIRVKVVGLYSLGEKL